MAKRRYTGPEKRAYLRVPSRCIIKCAKLAKNSMYFVNMIARSYTKDVSARGVRFIVRKKIPIYTILEFQFRIPGTRKNIAGLGEVVRIKLRRSSKSYDVGLRFLWLQRKNTELIDTYVRRKRIQDIIKRLH